MESNRASKYNKVLALLGDSTESPVEDFERRQKVIKAAWIMFPEGTDSIKKLKPNTAEGVRFLSDTLGFIDTHKRDMNITLWQTVLMEDGPPSADIDNSLGIGERKSPLLTILSWISAEGGYYDLWLTMRIINSKYW